MTTTQTGPELPMLLRARAFAFSFPCPSMIMGIVNVTPDSFSDGGRFVDAGAAVAHALRLAEEGADILDIGGESTRPNAAPVSVDEELRRVLPVIEQLAGRVTVPLSIDTMKPEVARRALEAGASIVNDVAANRTDDAMWRIVAEFQAGYVVMHMKGTPQTMQREAVYADVVGEVNDFFGGRLSRLAAAGVPPEQTILDVGIGFGKTAEHTLQLIGQLRRFGAWHRPLLLGVSRKSFMGQLLGASLTERLPASLACACWAVQCGAQMIRTHDVAATRQAVRTMEAILKHG